MTCAVTYTWTNSIVIARDAMSRDHNIYPIEYDDILAKLRQAFQWLNIDGDYVQQAIL